MTRSKPVVVAVQLVGAWAVGAVVLPTLWGLALVAAVAGGQGGWGVGALAGVAATLAYLLLVVSATRDVTVLGATGGRRLLWVLLVLAGGTAGWALGWAATDSAGLGVSRNPLWTLLLGGVPFVLVAALLVRAWPVGVAALTLCVALLVAGVGVLRHEPPDALDQRLAAASLHRENIYVVAVPGYRPSGDHDYGNGLGDGAFLPIDPAAVPPDKYVTIAAYDRLLPNSLVCGQPTAQDSRLVATDCTVAPNGLVYRHNEFQHGYQVAVGGVYVTVVGTPAVDRDLLQAAAQSLHLATTEELGGNQHNTGEYYAATIPGYTGLMQGTPAGMEYAPSDHSGNGAQSVSLSLHVIGAQGDQVCYDTVECTPDGAGHTYVRLADVHGYVVRKGNVDLQVMGGLRVDKALLLRAAEQARPPTDAELRRLLPPLKPNTPRDRFRQWLRDL